ncbi:MAG: hypothetical protein AAGI12_08060 [Pseudomonadota bacterium]
MLREILDFPRTVSVAAYSVAATLVLSLLFYEGIPLVRSLPLIEKTGMIGGIAEGRVRRFARLETAAQAARVEAENDRRRKQAERATAEREREGLAQKRKLQAARREAADNLRRMIDAELRIPPENHLDNGEVRFPDRQSQEPQVVRVPVPYTVQTRCLKQDEENPNVQIREVIKLVPRQCPNPLNERIPDRLLNRGR